MNAAPVLAPPRLHLQRRAATRHDLFALLRSLRGHSRWLWLDGEHALLGWDSAAALQAQSATEIVSQLAALPADLPDWPLFGGLRFDPSHAAAAEWQAFPAAEFILPRHLYALTENSATLSWLGLQPHTRPPQLAPQPLNALYPPARISDPLPFAAWEAHIRAAQQAMQTGDLQKVVLARTHRLHFDAPPPAETVFQRLCAAYPHTFRFFFEPVPGHIFLGATPELLVAASRDEIRTVALAGSAPRGNSPNSDENLAQALLRDPKNRREHALVVGHIVRELRALGLQPDYPAEPRIRRLPNIQHLETPIRAAAAGHHLLEIAAALHPTPALGGDPREAALAFIRQHEPHVRGWYGAPLGWLTAENRGILAVGIRSALIRGNTAWLYAGAGILPNSHPRAEWEETALKFRPLLEAFGVH